MEKINLKKFLFENFQTDNNICFSTKNPSIIKFINISESTEQLKTIKVKNRSEIPNDFTGIAIYPNGKKEWWLNGLKHRDYDLPAVEYPDGSKEWFLNGERHRETGPAIEHINGWKEWYLNGEGMSEIVWKKEIEKLNTRKHNPSSIDLFESIKISI